jgi:hypothetical protein
MTIKQLYDLVSEHLTEMLEIKVSQSKDDNVQELLDEVISEFLNNLAL